MIYSKDVECEIPLSLLPSATTTQVKTKAGIQGQQNNHHLAENRRKQHQDKLHDELNREAKERLLENKVNIPPLQNTLQNVLFRVKKKLKRSERPIIVTNQAHSFHKSLISATLGTCSKQICFWSIHHKPKIYFDRMKDFLWIVNTKQLFCHFLAVLHHSTFQPSRIVHHLLKATTHICVSIFSFRVPPWEEIKLVPFQNRLNQVTGII